MRKRRAILTILFWLFGVMVSWPQSSSASVPLGRTWDHTPTLSLNLNVNDPVDQAGQTDPWNNQAVAAHVVWNNVIWSGSSFGFSFNNNDENECDDSTHDRNAVEWYSVTTCGGNLSGGQLAVTTLSWQNGRFFNADVLFNTAYTWTSANPGATVNPPYNFNSVAIHEFGHALGLWHEDNTLAVMNSVYHSNPLRLHADDRLGVRSLYPGSGSETDIGPSVWKKTDGSSVTAASLVSFATSAVAGQAIEMEWTQENFGTTDVTFNIGFFLSTNNTISPSDTLLDRGIGASQMAGTSDTFLWILTIPLSTPPGTYYLGVCLDDDNAVAESNESNNCVAYPQTILVTPPLDLVVSFLSNPPASVPAGGSFSVTDTTFNQGTGPAAASTTAYRLSTDNTITASDPLLGSRGVPPLPPTNAVPSINQGTVTVTIPSTVAAGTYYLGACADDLMYLTETNETNNCRVAATTIQVTLRPDLRIRSLSAPPGTPDPVSGAWVFATGSSFSMEDQTENIGTAQAGTSTTRYRLSIDTTITATDPLVGSRSVPGPLPTTFPSSISIGTVAVTIPSTVAAGTYYLGACADDGNAVAESDETNNCRVAALIQVTTQPNLRVTAVSNPPASISVGVGFTMKDTTANIGTGLAGASTTRYRLSRDAIITAGPAIRPIVDLLLSGIHSVPALAAGATSSGGASVTIPATVATGTYYLGACADDGNIAVTGAVTESNESDNCLATSTTLQVINPMIISDLVIDSVSLSAASVAAGSSVNVTDTTANIGNGSTLGVSTTHYRLSTDSNITSTDLLLSSRSVSTLDAGTRSTGTVTVTIPSTVARGAYFLGACADGGNGVAESNEKNNCRATPITVQ